MNSPIRAVWGEGHRFNLNLTKAYATVDDEGRYSIYITKGLVIYQKEFYVTVIGKKISIQTDCIPEQVSLHHTKLTLCLLK